VAVALQLNEPLTEAICLAHDLGHTPFGHAGQDTLNACMRDYGGFEHNLQSLRVVDELEAKYADFPGLNLMFETREGILKHCSRVNAKTLGDVGERFLARRQPSLEAQLANLADEIAYNNHDIDDGLKAGYLKPEALMGITLWSEIYARVRQKYPQLNEERQVLQTISHLIGHLIRDLVEQSRANIVDAGIATLDDVRAQKSNLVMFSKDTAARNKELKAFLYKNLYSHYKVERMRIKAERFLTILFENYLQNPTLLPVSYQEKYQEYGTERVICDYIAGMTDRYALDEYKRLFEPYERV